MSARLVIKVAELEERLAAVEGLIFSIQSRHRGKGQFFISDYIGRPLHENYYNKDRHNELRMLSSDELAGVLEELKAA